MDAQSYTAQERRAANQVWAAAGAYGFEPLFLARYTDGTTDFYMNTIVGLVHKYYGDSLIRSIFDSWEGDMRQSLLDDLTWLYLESAAYRLELPSRPVLESLRRAHADYFFAIQYKLSRQEWMARNQLVYTMQAARWRRVLGRADPVMIPYESGLAAALAPAEAPEPEKLKAEILSIYAKFELFDGKIRQKAALHLHLDGLLAKLATKAMPTQMVKTDRVTVEHSGSADAAGGGLAVDKRRAHITLKQNAAQDRAYIESCFGRSLYPPERLRKAEQELCVGDHLGCHLWFSAGVPGGGEPPFLHGGSAAGCICLPPALSGGDRGTGQHPCPEPCRLRHPGAGERFQQPAGLHRAAGAQRLCRQKPAEHQPLFCFRLESRRPGAAGCRRPLAVCARPGSAASAYRADRCLPQRQPPHPAQPGKPAWLRL